MVPGLTCTFLKPQDSLFSDWRIQSNANNDINLEVSPDTLCSALRSCHSSPEVVMKLAKKDNQSVLTFDIQHVVCAFPSCARFSSLTLLTTYFWIDAAGQGDAYITRRSHLRHEAL